MPVLVEFGHGGRKQFDRAPFRTALPILLFEVGLTLLNHVIS